MASFEELTFPLLPENSLTPWPADVQAAHEVIQRTYNRAVHVLQCGGSPDPMQIAFHINALSSMALPVLKALISSGTHGSENECLPCEWLVDLQDMAGVVKAFKQHNVGVPDLVQESNSGQQGQPQKSIHFEFLMEVITNQSHHINLSELACILGVSHMTLCYTPLNDNELDHLVQAFKKHKPESGFHYLLGHLHHLGIHQSLHHVDRLGQHLWEHHTIQCRAYHVKCSNSLWHVDGHHKLIQWGFVIYSIIDGYSSTNNFASTVLDLFLDAKSKYGLLSCMRGDHGGENIDVATYMVAVHGPNHGSFMWGSYFAHLWQGFFTWCERCHCLDVENHYHFWLIQRLFLAAINNDCEDFQQEWNVHPDMWLISQATLGEYYDDFDSLHPLTLK
ncbi:hypothetical protein V8B97DRAFT_2025423 [Scleroderma yunnanense]